MKVGIPHKELTDNLDANPKSNRDRTNQECPATGHERPATAAARLGPVLPR